MNLSIEEIRELACAGSHASQVNSSAHPFEVGQAYFIRTVTMNITGRLVAVYPTELVVEDAAWIADSGRFMQALTDGTFNEVEPFPDGKVIIGRSALIDATIFKKSLPRSQK